MLRIGDTYPQKISSCVLGFFARGVSRKCLHWRGNFWKKLLGDLQEKITSEHRKTQNKALRRGSWTTPSQRPLFSAAEKNLKFLKTLWNAGCPWDTRPVSLQKKNPSVTIVSYVEQQHNMICAGHRPVDRGFAKGWFPKGWFRRMFPRNENRNEGTFAKTTLLETALLSPNDPFWGLTKLKGCFPKGWIRRMFPRNENRNEGTFAKTTLLRNRPFISQWVEPCLSRQVSHEHPEILLKFMCRFLPEWIRLFFLN